MRMIIALLALALPVSHFTFCSSAQAAIRPYYQDIKLPTQKLVEYQSWADLVASASTTHLSANAGNTSAAAATVTSFLGQPDVARNITITPGGSTGDVAACDIVVTGTDYLDNAITETFVIDANQATIETGSKAFKTVTSVAFEAGCEDSPYQATWYVGDGEKIGVKRCMDKAGYVLFSTLAGAKEATGPTMAADASVVSLNTADFVGSMNSSNDFELFFFQNFRCLN